MKNMNQGSLKRIGWTTLVFLLVWGAIRWFLPLTAPFLLGWLIAAMAEPVTAFLSRRRFPRSLSAGISVSLVLTVLLGLVWLVGALGWREVSGLAARVPEYAEAMSGRITAFRDWLLTLSERLPEGMGQVMARTVTGLFTESSVLLDKAASGALSAAGNVAGRIPGGALTVGTALISAYMIGGQYPTLKALIRESPGFSRRVLPAAQRLGKTVGLWLRAQLRLSGMTLAIVAGGLALLRVEHWLAWAVVTAIVDAVPILGTGTVLIPMALAALLWGEQVRAIGLGALYVTAMLTRSALEPRLVGRQLGMNPLLTLMALYAGYRIWGIWGMILSPVLAVTVRQIALGGE